MEKNQSIQQEKLELKQDCPQYFERDVSNNVNTQNMASQYIKSSEITLQSSLSMQMQDSESQYSQDQESIDETEDGDEDDDIYNEGDESQLTEDPNNVRHLPIANVSRVMKRILDTETKISKESKEMVQQCVTDFISFITCEACEKCKSEKRKTINGDDLIYALEVFGFDKYVKVLKLYLLKYRSVSILFELLKFKYYRLLMKLVQYSSRRNKISI